MYNPFYDHPILNSPYAILQRHWELDAQGQPTQRIIESRRRAEFITPIPAFPAVQLLMYRGGALRMQVRMDADTVWLTQRLMTELYQVTVANINQHLKAIYSDGELTPEATINQYLIVQTEVTRQVRDGHDTAVITPLAQEHRYEMPELRGFSERNIGRMIAFHRESDKPYALLPQAAAIQAG